MSRPYQDPYAAGPGSTGLPWQQQAPVGSADETAILDSPPSAPVAAAQASATVGDVQDMLATAAGIAADKAREIAQVEIQAHLRGQSVELSTTTPSGQKLKLADAKSRALRTLVQNLGVDILVALGTVVPMLLSMDFTDKAAWVVFGTSVAKTVVSVFVSYVSRLTAEPVIPTPVETAAGTVVQLPPGIRSAAG